MRNDLPKGVKVKEIDILEKIEKICDPEKPAGKWITHLDMLEDGKKIKLVEHYQPGKCKKECRTIAKACEEVIGDSDTDLAEALYKGDMQRAKLQNLLCRDLSDVCTNAPPSVPKSRKPIEEFVELSDKEVEMQELMATMGDIPGMPGMNMYSREDLEGMTGDGGGYGDDYGDYEEEDDDEAPLPMPPQEDDHGIIETVAGRVDQVVETVAKGVSSASEVAGDFVGKAADWTKNLFSGGKKGNEDNAEL
eukprot:CAMPEP_0196580438 /NCGR_PEP_ID=MMETSP1081-20130531/28629_1 /TAXON_ID=36882 /ORGANISM="Pyramimonas amylifera, Strain CCMP720" /LENGTH=248 /DNA_ID=CAMNT_0041900301 /DNA_START=257 /DNA_END=1003 /DNA_ORIENTATION=+